MKRSRPAVVVFAKSAQLGRVKTRLVPPLNYRQALELHRACLLATLRVVFSLPPSVSKWLYLAGRGSLDLPRAWRRKIKVRPQRGKDLGARMARAFAELFPRGADRVVIVGGDHPTLPRRRLLAAFRALERTDVVLGPSEDGGYYLVGGRRPVPAMFRGIPWGTRKVFRATLARLKRLRVPYSLLAPWYDIDRPSDLVRLRRELARRKSDSAYPREIKIVLEKFGPA